MRKLASALLLTYVFTIPWEYSLELGPPLGNISRIVGLLLLLVSVLAALQAGRFRNPGILQSLTLAFYFWLCCTYFWSVAPEVTLFKLRGYFQEMMIVWLAWELVDTPLELRNVCRAWVGGAWVLAVLTLADFAIAISGGSEQVRFVAFGQDPNDVARFLALGLPLAVLLVDQNQSWMGRILWLGYLPIAILGIVLTGSRSGIVTAAVASAGCAVLVSMRLPKRMIAGAFAVLGLALSVWLVTPPETLARIGTVVEQVRYGDLNQRINIWSAGWHAFSAAPFCGHGAGSFVTASQLAAIDTAHNTALSVVVEGGVVALLIASAILAVAIRAIATVNGSLRIAFVTAVAVWVVSSLAGTVTENRITWLLFAVIAVAARLAVQHPRKLEQEFAVRTVQSLDCMRESIS